MRNSTDADSVVLGIFNQGTAYLNKSWNSSSFGKVLIRSFGVISSLLKQFNNGPLSSEKPD
jgi:hypothetical protein